MSSNPGNRVAAVVILVLLVLPCAAMGGCFVTIAVSGFTPQDKTMGFGLAIPFCVACLLLLMWVRKLWRGR